MLRLKLLRNKGPLLPGLLLGVAAAAAWREEGSEMHMAS